MSTILLKKLLLKVVVLSRSDRHEFICFCEYFLWVKWSELFCCFIATSSEIGKKIKYLQAKQRTCREYKDNVIGREITTAGLPTPITCRSGIRRFKKTSAEKPGD